MDIDLSAVSHVANFKFDEFKEILRAVVKCVLRVAASSVFLQSWTGEWNDCSLSCGSFALLGS